MKHPIFFAILAGGKGERLWPLSRKTKPKQLLPFDQNKSLLELTIDHIKPISDKQHRIVITTQEQQPTIQKLVGDEVWQVMAEPATRNTGPAILLTCLTLAQQDPNAYIVFMPADHYFSDCKPFCEALTQLSELNGNDIGLIGIKPSFPATGYGYIEYQLDNSPAHRIVKFHEKPTESVAKNYCAQENMLWNIGVFGGTVSTFIKEYQQHAPQLYDSVLAYMNHKKEYSDIQDISIDYAIMEKSKNLYVIPLSCAWSDVGNLNIFLSLQHHEPNTNKPVISINSHDNLLSLHNKLVALIGVDNLCVVETEDVILISARNEAEKVKLVLQELKKNHYENYL